MTSSQIIRKNLYI